MIKYTHNGGPIVIDVHPDDKMIYAQWHVEDFLSGVQGLKPDVVGIYSIVLSLIYKSMGQLKDNDKWIAGHCNCDIRYYRKLRDALIASGKIFEADGYLYNNRAMAEIAKFCEMQRRKREAALAREQRKRQEHEQNTSEIDASCAPHARDARLTRAPYARPKRLTSAPQEHDARLTRSENQEKLNEINGHITTAVAELCQSTPTAVPRLSTEIEIEIEEDKKVTPFIPPSGADVVSYADDKITPLVPVGVDPPVRSLPIKTRKQGSRLPEEWKLPKSWGDWATQTFVISVDQVRREADSFRDYWVSKPGASATKLDWSATWRNWIRNKNIPERVSAQFSTNSQSGFDLTDAPEDIWSDVRHTERQRKDGEL